MPDEESLAIHPDRLRQRRTQAAHLPHRPVPDWTHAPLTPPTSIEPTPA